MTNDTENSPHSRRPISTRNAGWAQKIAQRLSLTGITPNQISGMSVVFGIAALVFFIIYARADTLSFGSGIWPLIGVIVCIQGRLLCNLFDGMVAMEGGKAGADGPFWNEFPDRIADICIIVGAGIAAGDVTLGWIAASLAVFVAYARELGRANGLPADFSGPMAKQHRMAVLTLATLTTIFQPLWQSQTSIPAILILALYVIVIGSVITILRRAVKQVRQLKSGV